MAYINIRQFYEKVDKRKLAMILVQIFNNTICKGHTWQCDDNENIYILRGPLILMKL